MKRIVTSPKTPFTLMGAVTIGAGVAAFRTSGHLGLLGTWLSALGVLLAWAIYLRQRVESDQSEKRTFARIQRLVATLGTESETETPDESGTVATAEESEWLRKNGDRLKNGYYVLTADLVPLKVLSNLVLGWEASGLTGQWVVGRVEAAFRKLGQGNHAWFVVFESDTEDKFEVWKVGKGGQSKPGPTATKVDSW